MADQSLTNIFEIQSPALDRIEERTLETTKLKTIIHSAKIDLIGRLFNAALRYAYVMVLARFLGAHLIGIFFLGVIVVDFLSVISRLGLDNGVLKYVAIYNGMKDQKRVKGIIYQSMLLATINALLIGIILFASAQFIAERFFHKPELGLVLKLLAIALPFYTNMLISLSSTQAFHTLKYRVYVENFMNPALNTILFLALFRLGWKLESVTVAYALSFMICAVLAFIYLKRLFPEILNTKIKPIFEFKKILKFSQPLLLIGFLNVVMMWTDSLMLGYFKSGGEVGIYNTAVKTAFFINFIIISFTSIFAPTISELYANKKIKELESLFKIITKWILALCLPIFLAIVLLSKNILSLFGDQFVSGYISLTILSVAHLINSAVGSVQYMLMMSEREKVALYITIGVCLLNFILNLILVPKYGINGAALATGTSIVVINIIMLIDVYKYLGIHPYNSKYIKPLVSALVVAGLGIILRKYLPLSNQVIFLMFNVTIYFLIYFLGLKLLKFDEQDQLILHTIRSKLGRN